MTPRLLACWLLVTMGVFGAFAAFAAEAAFPFGRDLMLDGKTTHGHKRLPTIAIEQDGTTAIDLWCGSARAQAAVGAGTISITSVVRDNAQCDPERIAGDDDLLDMLQHATSWRRRGDTIEFSGAATLRYHLMTN